jgi:hypothetical protein
MTRRWDDSIEEITSSNPGTGDLVLAGETNGNRPFSDITDIVDGDDVDYRVDSIDPVTNTILAWEIGSATYNSGANSLTRDTVFIGSGVAQDCDRFRNLWLLLPTCYWSIAWAGPYS